MVAGLALSVALGAVDEDVDGGKGRITTQLYLLNICEVTC